jgi:hypothetical protein
MTPNFFEVGDLLRFAATDISGAVVGHIEYMMAGALRQYVEVMSHDPDADCAVIMAFPVEYLKLVARKVY